MSQAVKDELVVRIEQRVEIQAAPEKVFEGLIRHLCNFESEDGKAAVTLKMEQRPGGRWYRDLGNDSGHLWGFIQSIKPPTLLEIFGPLMMSHPVAGHIIVRLTPAANGTALVFQSEVFGPIPEEFRDGMAEGWGQMLAALKRDVEG